MTVMRKEAEIGRDVAHGVVNHGGATVSCVEGVPTTPTSGYVVAVSGHEETEKLLDWTARRAWPARIVERLAADYARRKQAHLSLPGRALGAWISPQNALVFDVVEVIHEREAAILAGKQRGEYSIWDVAAGDEIVVTPERVI